MLLHSFGACSLSAAKSIVRKDFFCPTGFNRSDRSIRTRSSTVTSSLISVLKDEIKYEREYYRKPEELLEAAPNDFQIDNPPGRNSFYLLKVCELLTCFQSYTKLTKVIYLLIKQEHNNESIVIEVDLDYQSSDQLHDEDEEGETSGLEGEEEMDDGSSVRFRVRWSWLTANLKNCMHIRQSANSLPCDTALLTIFMRMDLRLE
jgi:hypothetical protein